MASKFVGTLMNSRNQAHAFHLTTNSFAAHKALEGPVSYRCSINGLRRTWASTGASVKFHLISGS